MIAFIVSVLASIVAALILAFTRDAWQETGLGAMMSKTARASVPRFLLRRRNLLRDRRTATAYLLQWLRRDQSRRGLHFGEFGRQAQIQEESRFQDRPTDFAAKPRLYLTGWPCFILHELGMGERSLEFAITGITRLLASGPIQARATVPAHPEFVPTVASFRHTFRAVQILYRLQPSNDIVVDLIGQMVDPHKKWQHADGGWPQFESDRRSDLWATTYAVALLHRASQNCDPLFKGTKREIAALIENGTAFLQDEWHRNKWKYAKASAAHNAIQICHELSDCLKSRDHQFLDRRAASQPDSHELWNRGPG